MTKMGSENPDYTSSTLAVVAISYNEENDLPGFLNNVTPWTDEVIIIDDGSNDRTREIAESYSANVRFIHSPRAENEYFSHQRNKGIAASSSDWILHMDIDERVPPNLAKEIRQSITVGEKDAYRFRRLNHFMHRPMRGGGWQDWNLVHLAKRDTLHFEGMFHEKCIVDCTAKRIGQLHNRMHHLNEDCFRKRLRKSELYLEEVSENIRAGDNRITGLNIFLRTVIEFLKKYIFKQGFRDGTPGLISALHSSTAIFRANALVWDEQNSISRASLEKSIEMEWQKASDTKLKQSNH